MTPNTLASRILSVLTLRELDILARRDPALMDVPVEDFAAALLDESPRRGRAARRPLRRPLAPRMAHGPALQSEQPAAAPPTPPAAAHEVPTETAAAASQAEAEQGGAAAPEPQADVVPQGVVVEPPEPAVASIAAANEQAERISAAAPSLETIRAPVVEGTAAAPPTPAAAPTATEDLALAEAAFARGDYPATTRLCGAHLESYFRPCASGGRAGAALLLKALRLRVEAPAAPLGEDAPAAEAAPACVPVRVPGNAKPCVILVGGLGRMADEYERLFDGEGCDLIFVENTPRGLKGALCASGIIVVTSNVSHPLREMAVEVAARVDCPIHYIDRPSLSGIRGELRAILGKAGAP